MEYVGAVDTSFADVVGTLEAFAFEVHSYYSGRVYRRVVAFAGS